jgi:hypothetical protein
MPESLQTGFMTAIVLAKPGLTLARPRGSGAAGGLVTAHRRLLVDGTRVVDVFWRSARH